MAVGQVAFVTRVLTHYRVRFHELVRDKLASCGIEYKIYCGRPTKEEAFKADLVSLDWATDVETHYLGSDGWVWMDLPQFDAKTLVVVGQENRLLNNYVLQAARTLRKSRVAFFGHGRNFQSDRIDGLAERFKRFWIGRVDWWFAYTEHSADIVKESGFPEDRITVFNNAIDMTSITETMRSISREDTDQLRDETVKGSQNVGIYIGGLYPLKRVPFLLEAAREIRARVPDFHLIIIGGGVDLELLRAAAQENPWIHVLGPRFDRDKAMYASLAKVFLMPGLVGLAVLDSFAYGLPMVTTDLSYHSPEIAYLKDGANGVVVPDSDDVEGYADEVARVLTDKSYRDELVAGASMSAREYSVEEMASRFADGAIAALSRGRRAD